MWRSLRQRYGLRWERRWLVARGRWKRRELTPVIDRTGSIGARDILVFSTLRNERAALPGFFDHYRSLGVGHFLIVDNGSTDGTGAWLAEQPDTSVWHSTASYAASRCGADWLNGLLTRYGHDHWTLTVDADERLVYPYCDQRPLPALCDWLEAGGTRTMGAMLLDLYPRTAIGENGTPSEQDDDASWFDSANYVISVNPRYRNLWIQGGPRMRAFFADAPRLAPALNKIPLVRWDRRYAYVSSTHALLPRGLNLVYARDGGELTCGVLLHGKFTPGFLDRARTEAARGEHFAAAREYRRYAKTAGSAVLWTPQSQRYEDWRQLETLGLISRGGWA
jgi:glycosyltransferase involved in cell wall biosynthesis